MRTTLIVIPVLLLQGTLGAQETSTFRAYVDTYLCARLMLGPITSARIECSQTTAKENPEPVLVRLRDNMVFLVNKTKMIKPLVGQFAEVSGRLKVRDGTMKLEDARQIAATAVPSGDPDRRLLDAARHKAADPKTWEKVRHELAMMPYLSEFDYISYTLSGSEVILSGWTVRQNNRDDAYNAVKDVPSVETVINNIEILPLGSMDMEIRAKVRAALQRPLSRYFWGTGSDIKIVVKNGQVILLGVVSTKQDSDVAFIQSNSVSGVFKVFNMLRVKNSQKS